MTKQHSPKRQLIDLSHTFGKNMPVWPGDFLPEISVKATVEKDGYFGQLIKTSMHVGTHIDAPAHMISSGKKLSEVSIHRLCGEGVLLDARGKKEIDVSLLNDFSGGEVVLIHTGWYKKFGTNQYYKNFPQITEAFANKLVEFDVHLIGLDTPSPDTEPYKIHKILLKKEILIIENVTNLEPLVGKNSFEVFAFPAKFESDGSPVRVVARVGS